VAKIVVLNASREDKEVVGQLTSTQMNDASAGVDAYDFIQENVNVFLMTEDRAQRTGDLIRRKQAGCDLVEHRSKEVIISLVDQRHTNWSFAQSADCGESSETTTDNDHMRQHQLHLKTLSVSCHTAKLALLQFSIQQIRQL